MKKDKIAEWLKRYKNRIIAIVVIVVVLTAAFFYGESSGNKTNTMQKYEEENSIKTSTAEKESELYTESSKTATEAAIQTNDNNNEDNTTNLETENTSDVNGNIDNSNIDFNNAENNTDSSVNIDENKNDGQSGGSNVVNTQVTTTSGVDNNNTDKKSEDSTEQIKRYCTISISCAIILNNMDKLDKDKKGLVPKDGWILKPVRVELMENETVFDLLKRVCMDKKIHMESSWTPMYNSAYIEGINNLYEFDCGSLSGWMYSVNGVYNNYGCSKVVINDGDIIEWVYTCDLGKDL